MQLTPTTPYFLVKLLRKKRDTGGRIIVPDTIKFMAYNLQCGEIVGVGDGAKKYFPEAKLGYTLIFHHFVEGEDEKDARVNHLVDQDQEYNYYVVTAYECNGKNVETYGVWDGEKIIPNKDYIFLKPEERVIPDNQTPDEMISQALQPTKSGLLLFKNWEESREEKEVKQAEIKKEVQELSKSGNHKFHIKQEILRKEEQMESLSRDMNKKKYLPFKVEFYNKDFLTHFTDQRPLRDSDDVYVLNIAASTEITFNGANYIVAKTKYADCIIRA